MYTIIAYCLYFVNNNLYKSIVIRILYRNYILDKNKITQPVFTDNRQYETNSNSFIVNFET